MAPLITNFFLPEEEKVLIKLKEEVKPELSWAEIQQNYAQHFPNSPRSKGGLQVHYSRKLQPSKRKTRRASIKKLVVVTDSDTDESITTTYPKTPDSIMSKASTEGDINKKRTRRAIATTIPAYKCNDESDSSLSPSGESHTKNLSPCIKIKPDLSVIASGTKDQTMMVQTLSNINNNDFAPLKIASKLDYNLAGLPRMIRRSSAFTHTAHQPQSDFHQVQSEMEKRSTLLDEQPVIKEGWIPADLETLRGTINAPKIFTHPPADRIVEYNTRSNAYRIRSRRADDAPICGMAIE